MYLKREDFKQIKNILAGHWGQSNLNHLAWCSRMWVKHFEMRNILYGEFWIDKVNKNRIFNVNELNPSRDYRPIKAPKTLLKSACWDMNNQLIELTHGMYWIKGFNREESVISNALYHWNIGAKCAVNIDLKGAFTQITFRNLYHLARIVFDWNKRTALKFAKMMTLKGRMVQGNPLSPTILNIIALALDMRLLHFCKKHKYYYTRYADDLVITSTQSDDEKLRRHIRSLLKILNSSGFKHNKDKVKYRKTHLEITGVYLMRNSLVTRRRKLKQQARALLGLYANKGYETLLRVDKNGKPINTMNVLNGITEWLYPKPLNRKLRNSKQQRLFTYTIPKVYLDAKALHVERKKQKQKAKRIKKFTERELSCSSDEMLILYQCRKLKTV